MQKKTWVGLLITGIAILVVTLLVGLVIGALRQVQTDGPIGDVPDDVRSLIANPPTVDCVALATKYNLPTVEGKVVLTYIPNKVDEVDPAARNASEAVNVSAIPAELDRILASHCTQPEEAGMSGVGLVTQNPVLVELNSELFGQFEGITAKEWADKVFSDEISYDDATTTMTQLAGFLTVFNSSYQTNLATDWNYYAQAGVVTLEADVRPIIENPNQYTGDFWYFEIIGKEGNVLCVEDLEPFGINLGVGGDITKGDQRIAGFTCDVPPTPEVPTPEVPTPPEEQCPADKPHGTPATACKDGVEAGPAAQDNIPIQQQPNVLLADPELAQPVQPALPAPTYTAPAPVEPSPAPSITPNPDPDLIGPPPTVVSPVQTNGPVEPPAD